MYMYRLLDIPKTGKVKGKEDLKIMLKWGKFLFSIIFDCKIFTFLKNKQ